MLKAARKAKPDLINWLRPTLKVNRTPEFEHRIVELTEYLWSKGKLRLYASKTENQRDRPLWDCIRDVAQRRINEGLTGGELLFPRAKTVTFDHAIARACRNASKLQNSTTAEPTDSPATASPHLCH